MRLDDINISDPVTLVFADPFQSVPGIVDTDHNQFLESFELKYFGVLPTKTSSNVVMGEAFDSLISLHFPI